MRYSRSRRPRRKRRKRDFNALYAKLPEHRRPKLQLIPLLESTPGKCRWCAGDVANGKTGRTRTWHDGRGDEPGCSAAFEAELEIWRKVWRIQTRPGHAKRTIAERDGKRCVTCKVTRGNKTFAWLHLDHRIPLADGGSLDAYNLQLLCPDCHTAKTSREATERAARRRIVKESAALNAAA